MSQSVTEKFANAGKLPSSQNEKRNKKQIRRLSVRLDESERTYLESLAGSETLSSFVRQRLLGDVALQKKTRPKRKAHKPKIDQTAAAQLLASLGKSRLASNVNQISKLANSGALPVSSELEAELAQACLNIAWMRATLIIVLGIKYQ